MEFCTQDLSGLSCIGVNVLAFLPLLALCVTALAIHIKPSYILEWKSSLDFQENQTLIERSKLNRALKQTLSIVAGGLFIPFLIFYISQEKRSIAVMVSYALQSLAFFVQVFFLQWEYNKQGSNSLTLVGSYCFNFLCLGGTSTILIITNHVELDCFVLLIIFETTSLLATILVGLRRTDFTKEAMLLQKYFATSQHANSTGITNNGYDNQEDQNSLLISPFEKVKMKKENKNEFRYGDSRIKQEVPSKQENKEPNGSIETDRTQSSFFVKNSFNDEEYQNMNKMTPNFSCDSFLQQVEEQKYKYKDIKVIGYKAKENKMLFVISYVVANKVIKTDRSHNDFKYLSQLISEELKSTSLTLPQLPKRIKQSGEADQKILKEKMIKFNRFLFYIEFHKIESDAIDRFLISSKTLAVFAPIKELKSISICPQSSESEPEKQIEKTEKQIEKTEKADSSPLDSKEVQVLDEGRTRVKSETSSQKSIEVKGSNETVQTPSLSDTPQSGVSSSLESNEKSRSQTDKPKISKIAEIRLRQIKGSQSQLDQEKSEQKLSQDSTEQERNDLVDDLKSQAQDEQKKKNKKALYSFSSKEDDSQQNLFFKQAEQNSVVIQQQEALPQIFIPITKEMSGKTYYDIEIHYSDRKVHHISKRYNDFKEFHKQMKDAMKNKPSSEVLLPELPYQPSSKSEMSLVEYRKMYLASYLTKIWKIPNIKSYEQFVKFISENSSN